MPNSMRKTSIETPQKNLSPSSNKSGSSERSKRSVSSGKARKRKRREQSRQRDTDLEMESEFEDYDLENAIAIEKKIRKVGKDNSLNDEEMQMLVQKFVKNEHILALVTLKAEEELARERQEEEKSKALIIMDTSTRKLTRAKARELNKTPNLMLPTLNEPQQPEIAALIKDDLHSDEEDEEYTFKEDDFSDDDPSTTISDFDSNPCTPQTPLLSDAQDSPVKYTSDGCFKIPIDKRQGEREDDVRIAMRTRSKLCLQETTIEDIQSEFVPPDVEALDASEADPTMLDEEWMRFLNDFTKPLNNSFLGDDDDPIDDPEYVAAEKERVDAEELRDVNISKKELSELIAELFEDFSLENVELSTPQKLMQNNALLETPIRNLIAPTEQEALFFASSSKAANNEQDKAAQVVRQLEFNTPITLQQQHQQPQQQSVQRCVSDATISSTNITQNEYSFHPNVMSTPSVNNIIVYPSYQPQPQPQQLQQLQDPIPIASAACDNTIIIPPSAVNTEPELVAIPVPGQPNCYQLVKIVSANDEITDTIAVQSTENVELEQENEKTDTRYKAPYDDNYTWEYISVRRHVYSEYMEKFENLRHLRIDEAKKKALENAPTGFTKEQHDILQQQLRIHVQMLTQNFVQTYAHPNLWKMSFKLREMLKELYERAKEHAAFNAWNLNGAIELVNKWEEELSEDTEENKKLVEFIHEEISKTNRNTRQICRFHPRIMDLLLNSNVIMYPQYLPRIAFGSKISHFHVFSPSEEQLLAMGLEKHIKRIEQTNEKLPKNTLPFFVACRRIAKDTIFGKPQSRVIRHIRDLKMSETYNPVKYYFEHGYAPPIEHKLEGFTNQIVLPPKDRFYDLPLVWQKYLHKQRNPQTVPAPHKKKKPVVASEKASASYLEFVREALSEDVPLLDTLGITVEPPETAANNNTEERPATESPQPSKTKQKSKSKTPQSVTINVNYIYNTNISPSSNNFNTTPSNVVVTSEIQPYNASPPVRSNTNLNTRTSPSTSSIIASALQELNSNAQITNEAAATAPAAVYNFDWNARALVPVQNDLLNSTTTIEAQSSSSKLHDNPTASSEAVTPQYKTLPSHLRRRNRRRALELSTFSKRSQKLAQKHRQRCALRRRCGYLLSHYKLRLSKERLRYAKVPIVQYFYQRFKALELYTSLLGKLKMFCRNAAVTQVSPTTTTSTTTTTTSLTNGTNIIASNTNGCANNNNSNSNNNNNNANLLGKRPRVFNTSTTTSSTALEDDNGAANSRGRKANRQEENFRHMLLPDSTEDANRKDAIYAFNFYEKVEDVLRSSNRPEDCKKFNQLLKTFNPKSDKVADLYNKMEELFLPDHPELAEVFLTFLLPSEAAETGKFFEYFMITNAATFINKLNVYFSNQPAQIRKIYNCLNELAEDPEVTVKKVEAKILPLLKGNQFLIEWFMQQFPKETPPERLLPTPEYVNLKEVQNYSSGDSFETLTDLMDSPTQEQQQGCQLKYINGRIFYGSRILLPAKLSFMATSLIEQDSSDSEEELGAGTGCVHGIRESGENCLAAAAATAAANAASNDCNSDENERIEDEGDISRVLIIDTGEDENSTPYETCDQATLRSHALRLNPNYYSSLSMTTTTTAPNPVNPNLAQYANVRKTSYNANDECRISPRKHSTPLPAPIIQVSNNSSNNIIATNTSCTTISTTTTTTTTTTTATATTSGLSAAQLREKRKSPLKKVRSPICTSKPRAHMQPMVVIHEQIPAIACAKKLKSLIDSEDNESEIDSKERLNIVARDKHDMQCEQQQNNSTKNTNTEKTACVADLVPKIENTDDLEFIPEHMEVSAKLPRYSFSSSNSQDGKSYEVEQSKAQPEQHVVSSTQIDSDEDCKLDIVASLATDAVDAAGNCSSKVDQGDDDDVQCTSADVKSSSAKSSPQIAWTRDEDKVILIEMKLGSRDLDDLFQRIHKSLPNRSIWEITSRHQFLMEFLSKLQGK